MNSHLSTDDALLDLDRCIENELQKLKELIAKPEFKLISKRVFIKQAIAIRFHNLFVWSFFSGCPKLVNSQAVISSQPTANDHPPDSIGSKPSNQVSLLRVYFPTELSVPMRLGMPQKPTLSTALFLWPRTTIEEILSKLFISWISYINACSNFGHLRLNCAQAVVVELAAKLLVFGQFVRSCDGTVAKINILNALHFSWDLLKIFARDAVNFWAQRNKQSALTTIAFGLRKIPNKR